jgi:hypothetical protein
MRPGFDMHGDDVGASLGEGFEIRVARRDHQMHVDGFFGQRPQRLDDRRADRNVRHEVPVHHVDMDPVGAGRLDRAHFLAEPREIGRQDRGCNYQGPRHGILQKVRYHAAPGRRNAGSGGVSRRASGFNRCGNR